MSDNSIKNICNTILVICSALLVYKTGNWSWWLVWMLFYIANEKE